MGLARFDQGNNFQGKLLNPNIIKMKIFSSQTPGIIHVLKFKFKIELTTNNNNNNKLTFCLLRYMRQLCLLL